MSLKRNLFTMRGNEVLIKAVAETNPTYTMIIFQFPLALYKELGLIVMWFWRGSREGKGKLIWVAWDKACWPN